MEKVISNILVSDTEGGMTVLDTPEEIEKILLLEPQAYETAETCSDYNEDNEKLKSLLIEFNLIQLLPTLQSANVTYRCLQYIQKEDLVKAIPHLGLRVEFREKLFMWRKKEFVIDDETISNPSKIKDWLSRGFPNVSSPSSLNSSVKRVLNMAEISGFSSTRTYKNRF